MRHLLTVELAEKMPTILNVMSAGEKTESTNVFNTIKKVEFDTCIRTWLRQQTKSLHPTHNQQEIKVPNKMIYVYRVHS